MSDTNLEKAIEHVANSVDRLNSEFAASQVAMQGALTQMAGSLTTFIEKTEKHTDIVEQVQKANQQQNNNFDAYRAITDARLVRLEQENIEQFQQLKEATRQLSQALPYIKMVEKNNDNKIPTVISIISLVCTVVTVFIAYSALKG